MADKLTDQQTKHWTGSTQSMCSLLRIDGKIYRVMGAIPRNSSPLTQTGVEVLPTHTIYHFTSDGVRLTVTFLNPLLPGDLEILSRPVTYLTWQVESIDGNPHTVEIYFDASSELTVNTNEERVDWARFRQGRQVSCEWVASASPYSKNPATICESTGDISI